MFCPIVCSCPQQAKKIDTPHNYHAPPRDVICPVCEVINDTEYRKTNTKCKICFCCSIPCGNSAPYLTCKNCGYAHGNIEAFRCRNCRIATSYRSSYCPECGERK